MFFTYVLIVQLVSLLEEVLSEVWEGYRGQFTVEDPFTELQVLTGTCTLWALSRISIGLTMSKLEHIGEQRQEPGLDASLLLLFHALSPPHSPEIVGLFVIGGFLMSPFKMFKYFFFPGLQEVNIYRFLKKN